VDIDEYQRIANLTDQRPGDDEAALVFPLVGLASEVGSLMNQYKKRVRDGDAHALFSERVAEELGDVLWYVSNVSHKIGLRLSDVAGLNLKRIAERWPAEADEGARRLLDEDFPPEEQLPRHARVEFIETVEDGRPRVRLLWDGKAVGNPLADMAWMEDEYRYHDAFHLAYAAMLGWSPISRSFFGRQRSSDLRFREIEDSGRAKVIEEAISALAFEYARKERFLDGVDHLDYSLLRMIADMASGYEVRIRTVREWELCILRSFEVWRDLRRHRGGTLELDLVARTVRFAPPTG
jgi:NTP pyrophosphatase (non-canonical NTP hydrolase)